MYESKSKMPMWVQWVGMIAAIILAGLAVMGLI